MMKPTYSTLIEEHPLYISRYYGRKAQREAVPHYLQSEVTEASPIMV